MEGNPFSWVRGLLMNPLITTHIPSAVSIVLKSYLFTIGAEENSRTACFLKPKTKTKTKANYSLKVPKLK